MQITWQVLICRYDSKLEPIKENTGCKLCKVRSKGRIKPNIVIYLKLCWIFIEILSLDKWIFPESIFLFQTNKIILKWRFEQVFQPQKNHETRPNFLDFALIFLPRFRSHRSPTLLFRFRFVTKNDANLKNVSRIETMSISRHISGFQRIYGRNLRKMLYLHSFLEIQNLYGQMEYEPWKGIRSIQGNSIN